MRKKLNWKILLVSIFLFPTLAFGGIDLSGDADYIGGIGDSASLDMAMGDFSISCWFRSTGHATAMMHIVAKIGDAPNYDGYRIGIRGSTDKFRASFVTSGSWYQQESGTSVEDNVWRNAVVTYDRDVGMTIYLNGSSDGSRAINANGINNDGDFEIGRNPATGSGLFIGDITEVAVWKTVLTATDISLLANAKVKGIPLQIQPSTLVGYWPLDDNPSGMGINGKPFLDRSGNGNDGSGTDADGDSSMIAESVLSYP